MKNVVKIADVYLSKEVESKQGIKHRILNISLVEKISSFKIVEDEKVEKKVSNLSLRESDFVRLIALDDTLALVEERTGDDSLSYEDNWSLKHRDRIRCLKGASLTIDREIVEEEELNEDGDIVLDEEGKPIKKLIGFGETKLVSLQLTKAGERLAEKLVFGE